MPRRDPRLLAVIAAGGFAGAIARVALDEAIPPPVAGWPWATLAVNVAGALLLGWLVVRLRRDAAAPWARPLVGTGFCGALTTFSTVQVELLRMLDAGRLALALAYAAVSVLAGLAAVSAGAALARDRGARA